MLFPFFIILIIMIGVAIAGGIIVYRLLDQNTGLSPKFKGFLAFFAAMFFCAPIFSLKVVFVIKEDQKVQKLAAFGSPKYKLSNGDKIELEFESGLTNGSLVINDTEEEYCIEQVNYYVYSFESSPDDGKLTLLPPMEATQFYSGSIHYKFKEPPNTIEIEEGSMATKYWLREYNGDDGDEYSVKDYEGEVNSSGEAHGYGTMYFNDGSYYEGDWEYGDMEGEGTYVFNEESDYDYYEGEFSDDKFNGFGILVYRDGRVYEGEFEDDWEHGFGRLDYNEGSSYEGDWNKGYMHGYGKYDFSSKERDNWDYYEGEMFEDYFEGEGSVYYNDGSVYHGSMSNDLYDGYGEIEWRNGDSYKGYWQEGYRHGQGTYTYADGTVEEGIFEWGDFLGNDRRGE